MPSAPPAPSMSWAPALPRSPAPSRSRRPPPRAAADAFRPPILPPLDPPAPGYFSCSINPFTNRRCMKITTSTGGSIASIEVAMISCHTGSESGTATMR